MTHPSHVSCSSTAPNPPLEASVFTLVLRFILKCVFSVRWRIVSFILLKAASCCSCHTNFVSFCKSLRKSLHVSARFGMNFVRWWMLPKNDLGCFCVFGCWRLRIACVFETIGLMPFLLVSYPSHDIFGFAKWHSSMFIASFSSSGLSRHLNSFSLWFCIPPFVTIIMSSWKLSVFEVG